MAILNSRNSGTTLSLNDLIHAVDVSDPTDDPLGTSKKWTIQQLADLISGSFDTFVELTDTPASYAGAGDYLVKVNAGATGLEFLNPSTYNISNFNNDAGYLTSLDFLGLTDTPSSYTGHTLKVVRVNAGETALEFATISSGSTTYTGLTDTPSSYTGDGNKFVRVNAGATALEHVAASTIAISTFNNDAGFITSNLTHTGEVTGGASLTAHPTIISNKTLVTPVATDMLLLWDATDSALKRVDASNFLGGAAQNLWEQFTADTGSATANTTTDIFAITGGVGISTAIVGDTLTITNDSPNATHTGEVTGASSLTIDKTAITNKTLVTAASGDFVLISDTGDAGNLKKADVSDFLISGAAGLNDLTDVTLTGVAQGDVLYRNATGWVNLGPGTNGQVLTSGGAAANVSWTTIAGGTDGNGIYDGNGTIPSATTATITDTINFATGSLGINKTPTEKLDVNGNARVDGKTITQTFQLTTTPTNGHVLTSDASGNATWQAAAGGGNTIYSADDNIGGFRTILLSDGATTDRNLRFSSIDSADLLYLDATNDRVGIGTNAPGSTLGVFGTFEVQLTGSAEKIDFSSTAGAAGVHLNTGVTGGSPFQIGYNDKSLIQLHGGGVDGQIGIGSSAGPISGGTAVQIFSQEAQHLKIGDAGTSVTYFAFKTGELDIYPLGSSTSTIRFGHVGGPSLLNRIRLRGTNAGGYGIEIMSSAGIQHKFITEGGSGYSVGDAYCSTNAGSCFMLGTSTRTAGVKLKVAGDTRVDGGMSLNSTTKTLKIMTMTAVQGSAITPVNGDMIYVTSTDGTFTSIGFWGYEGGSWTKL